MGSEAKKTRAVAFKAGVWYLISNIMVKAIAVITTPIFTRLMTTAEYGSVQTFISWHTLLLPVYSMNLYYSIGRAKLDYPERMNEYIGSMQLLAGLISAAISAVALLLIRPVSGILELTVLESVLLIIYLFFGPSIQLFQNGFRYRYQYKQNIAIAWYSAVSTTLLSLLLILIVKENKDTLRMIGIAVPAIALSCCFWVKSLAKGRLKVNREFWSYGLKISAPLVLHTISMHILSQSDRIFITKIWDKSYTGLYSLAYTYGMLLHVFTTAVSESWLPWFHDTYFDGEFDEIKKNVKPLVILGCYIGLASIAFGPEAVLILGGHKYTEAAVCVPPIVMGVVSQFVYTHYVNVELHLKKTMYVSYGTIFAAVLNMVLNAVFIPRFGYQAAAYTTLASYLALMIVHCIITKKVLRVNIYSEPFMFGSLAVTFVISAGLMLLYDHNIARYCVIAVGFATFLFYFRDYIKKWIRKKGKKA